MLQKLDALKRDIAAGEATRSEVADQLAGSERAISEANRKLHNLSQQQVGVQNQLSDIERRRGQTAQTIGTQQRELARMLHDQYLAGNQDPFRLLLSGDNPNRIQRDFQYEGYVSVAVAGVLRDLKGSLDQLQDLSSQAQARNQELASIAASQQAERGDLVRDEEQRRATLAQISEKLQSQRAEAGALERDERRLSQVVEQLGKLIERQAREAKERERQRQLAREKQLQLEKLAEHRPEKPVESESRPTLEGTDENSARAPATGGSRAEIAPETPFSGNLLALRGKMRLPVQGELAGRFGATRSEGGPSWKGLFIRAPAATEVHAIAPGRVVFAEWLRGFGNLLIIDHGDQYLSIYGNNESLLKQPGDIVKMGDVVATVGNSGGNPETGLYFEMRYQGKPFDPLAWVSGR
ncbi:MAG: peptidoglycan DD-metalloendopeptidase family protein [Burkholderiaceae bacterium]|jgi:septal ring factor EnvC (AmiA/AmiB activator)